MLNRLRVMIAACFVLCLVGLCSQAHAQVIVERTNYRGWPDSYRLTAGRYRLVLSANAICEAD